MKGRTRIALMSLLAVTGVAHAAEFEITISNLGPQPLSPLFYSAGDNQFNIFDVGGSASLGIKNIAESGDTAAMLAIAAAAAPHSGTFGVVGGAPLAPGGTLSTTFTTDLSHGFFSFASMLGQTNDGFIGESLSSMGITLFNGGTPQGFDLIITGARAWDAGTELNTQNAADLAFLGGAGNPAENAGDDHIRIHETIVVGVGDSWQLMPDWSTTQQLARITVTPVPEPATLLALGVAGLALMRRRRSRAV